MRKDVKRFLIIYSSVLTLCFFGYLFVVTPSSSASPPGITASAAVNPSALAIRTPDPGLRKIPANATP